MIDGIVYVGGGDCDRDERCIVCRYHPGEDEWSTLPPSPVGFFGIGSVSGQLVLVGGIELSTKTRTQGVYMFTSELQQWEQSIPAMLTARAAPAVVSHSTTLVVCGGNDNSATPVSTVELYSSESSQWYQCPPLPFPCAMMSSVTIGDTLFLVGGYEGSTRDSATRTVISVSLSTLIERTLRHSSDSVSTEGLWIRLRDVPYYRCTAANIGGCLLALGGGDEPERGKGTTTASIHIYVTSFPNWLKTEEFQMPLSQATAVLLPTNKLLVVGGSKTLDRTKLVFQGALA